MTIRGIRKALNDNPEAQRASVEAAAEAHRQELDACKFRQAISWYDVKSGLWLSLEWPSLFSSVVAGAYADMPRKALDYVVYPHKNDKSVSYPIEIGFLGDGLPRAVWIEGGQYKYSDDGERRIFFDIGRSKVKSYQRLITRITQVPPVAFELYHKVISIPDIQIAFKQLEENSF